MQSWNLTKIQWVRIIYMSTRHVEFVHTQIQEIWSKPCMVPWLDSRHWRGRRRRIRGISELAWPLYWDLTWKRRLRGKDWGDSSVSQAFARQAQKTWVQSLKPDIKKKKNVLVSATGRGACSSKSGNLGSTLRVHRRRREPNTKRRPLTSTEMCGMKCYAHARTHTHIIHTHT